MTTKSTSPSMQPITTHPSPKPFESQASSSWRDSGQADAALKPLRRRWPKRVMSTRRAREGMLED